MVPVTPATCVSTVGSTVLADIPLTGVLTDLLCQYPRRLIFDVIYTDKMAVFIAKNLLAYYTKSN